MPLSKVESFVYGGNCAHFVTAFKSADGPVTSELKPMEGDKAVYAP